MLLGYNIIMDSLCDALDAPKYANEPSSRKVLLIASAELCKTMFAMDRVYHGGEDASSALVGKVIQVLQSGLKVDESDDVKEMFWDAHANAIKGACGENVLFDRL